MTKRPNHETPRHHNAFVLAALVLLVGGPVAAEARSQSDRGASRSRSSTSVSSQRSAGPRVAVPRGRASSPRSPGRSYRSPGSHRGGGGHVRLGVYYGRFPYWGGYWGPWPYYSSFWWGAPGWGEPHGVRYVGERLCAVDLNIKPKSTEVFVDGDYVGVTGEFDGYPGYLWLERGPHEVVLHKPGFETEVLEVTARGGTVERVHHRLREGETVPPEQVMAQAAARPAVAPPPPTRPGAATPRASAPGGQPGALDVRGEPARFRVSIAPQDASVYLDGRFLGTGAELAGLHAGLIVEPGAHQLEVVRPGYASKRADFSVAAGNEVGVSVELEPR